MINRIRYRILMRRLRGEIAAVVCENSPRAGGQKPEKIKTAVATACKACGSIV